MIWLGHFKLSVVDRLFRNIYKKYYQAFIFLSMELKSYFNLIIYNLNILLSNLKLCVLTIYLNPPKQRNLPGSPPPPSRPSTPATTPGLPDADSLPSPRRPPSSLPRRRGRHRWQRNEQVSVGPKTQFWTVFVRLLERTKERLKRVN